MVFGKLQIILTGKATSQLKAVSEHYPYNVHSKVSTLAVDFPNFNISKVAKVLKHGQSLRHEKGLYEEIPNEKSHNLKKYGLEWS